MSVALIPAVCVLKVGPSHFKVKFEDEEQDSVKLCVDQFLPLISVVESDASSFSSSIHQDWLDKGDESSEDDEEPPGFVSDDDLDTPLEEKEEEETNNRKRTRDGSSSSAKSSYQSDSEPQPKSKPKKKSESNSEGESPPAKRRKSKPQEESESDSEDESPPAKKRKSKPKRKSKSDSEDEAPPAKRHKNGHASSESSAKPSSIVLPKPIRRCTAEGTEFTKCEHDECWDDDDDHLSESSAFLTSGAVHFNSNPDRKKRSTGPKLYTAYCSWFAASRRKGAQLLSNQSFYKCLRTRFCAMQKGKKSWMFYDIRPASSPK